MAGTIQHQWNGTVLTITSDSGTSSCDLKGAKGDDGPRGAQGAPGSSVAEDSQKLGGVAAESYALKTDTIENANKLGNVVAAQYALKNNVPAHNLLDNSDFTNPVNQRNSAYYTNGNEYTIDRWKTQYGTNISIENGYINIWGNWDLKQRLKKPLGIIYTLAAKVRINFTGDNTPAIGIDGGQKLELDAPIDEWRIYAKQVDISSITDETIEIQLAPNGGSSSGSISVEWVALYEGAYDASTLPAYQPKGYAAELAECKRYFERKYKNILTMDERTMYLLIDYADKRLDCPTISTVITEVYDNVEINIGIWNVKRNCASGIIGTTINSANQAHWYGYVDIEADL